jgi:hypothetical protein
MLQVATVNLHAPRSALRLYTLSPRARRATPPSPTSRATPGKCLDPAVRKSSDSEAAPGGGRQIAARRERRTPAEEDEGGAGNVGEKGAGGSREAAIVGETSYRARCGDELGDDMRGPIRSPDRDGELEHDVWPPSLPRPRLRQPRGWISRLEKRRPGREKSMPRPPCQEGEGRGCARRDSAAAGRRKASGRTERTPRPRPSPPPPSSGERRRGGRRATAELCLLLYRAGKSRTSSLSLTLCSPCWEAARHVAPPRARSISRGRGLRREGIGRRGRGGGPPVGPAGWRDVEELRRPARRMPPGGGRSGGGWIGDWNRGLPIAGRSLRSGKKAFCHVDPTSLEVCFKVARCD